jgi:uncharacterized protein with ParB-like and HNH nuclease domain
LGSIILKKNAGKKYEYNIIDGQQRLISLSILFAVIRDLIGNADYHKYVYREENRAEKVHGSPRLILRDHEMDFYKKYIVSQDGTTQLLDQTPDIETEPKKKMVRAAKIFNKYLTKFFSETQNEMDDYYAFGSFLLNDVVMVKDG